MLDSYNPDNFSFEEVKKALLDQGKPFPANLIYYFSDIPSADYPEVTRIWQQVWTERRRGLLEDMEKFAEGDTLLNFDPLAVFCLGDPDPVARATAVRLLWQSEDEDLAPRFVKMLKEDPEDIVRAAAATALGIYVYYGELEEISENTYAEIVKALIESHLKSPQTLVRRRALEALGFASHSDIPDFIQQAYDTQDEEWLQSALFAMGRSYDQRWRSHVLTMIDHPDSVVRYEAVRAAGELEIEEARDAIFDLLEQGTDDEELYFAAIWALTQIGGAGVREMIQMSRDETEDMDEVLFLDEALANLDFTEQTQRFDLMEVDEFDQYLKDEGYWDDKFDAIEDDKDED